MASSDLRYGSNTQNTSKYMQDLLNEFIKMPHGVFDETRKKIMDVTVGAIHPIECWEMLPGSDAYLNYDLQLITKNPTIKRLLTSMKAELRVYQVNYNDCWEGWNNFITKGRSGKVALSIPYVDLSLGNPNITTSLPYNPLESLSLQPCVHIAKDDNGKKFTVQFNQKVQKTSDCQYSGKTAPDFEGVKNVLKTSALPLVFYNKIVKKFLNPNLVSKNPNWYPENENHDMILPYSATGPVTTSDYFHSSIPFNPAKMVDYPSEEKSVEGYKSFPWLNVLQYAQRRGDMFNSGSPFPDLIRGDVPTLQVLNAQLDWSNVIAPHSEDIISSYFLGVGFDSLNKLRLGKLMQDTNPNQVQNTRLSIQQNEERSQYHIPVMENPAGGPYVKLWLDKDNSDLLSSLNQATVSGIEFSAQMWRYLMTMTVLKERLALTDGSYNQMIKAMFGHNPNWHSHDCKYCGGSSQPIIFSEVVNTADTGNAPLGETAGRAISSSMNNTIHVHADDFGMFMTVLVLTQDEYYSQGLDKMFSRLENSEQYLPILNNLSPDATLNKELFVSGNSVMDNDVFNYQERFSYYKSRRNQVSGLMSLPISKIGDIGAYLFNRIFRSTPNFNQEFCTNNLTDNEKAVFASTNQAEFCAVIGSQMKYIAPIPEDSRPSDMGISY